MKTRLLLSLLVSMPFTLWAQVATPVPMAPTPVPTPAVNPKTAPKIVCASPNFDFGNMDEGPDITHQFRCRNAGHGKLIVTGVSTSCGCTAAVAQKASPKGGNGAPSYPVTFTAGEAVIIKATYHTQGRPGHATKIITVASNDPANPNFQLKLDMTVVRDVDVQPDRLYLYGVKKDESRTSTIKILGKPNHPLHVLSATAKSGTVTVTSLTPFEDPNEHRSGATLVVDLSKGLTIGGFTDEILVKTDSVKKPEVTISVLGEVRGNVQFNPKTLYFSPHQDIPVTISFQSETPKSFVIRSVESLKHLTRPHVFKTTGPDGVDQYSVAVNCIKDLPKDSDGKDQIVVITNDPEMGRIIIDAQVNK